MKTRLVFTAIAMALLFSACRKSGSAPEWDVDAVLPIATGNLDYKDFIDRDYITEGPSSELIVTFNDTVFSLRLDTLFDVPDTSVSDQFFLPFGPITFAPGQTLIDDTIRTKYDLNDIELTSVRLKEGTTNIELSSTLDEASVVTYGLPLATLNGQPLQVTDTVPANGSISRTYDLAGYTIDLTGFEGDRVNTVLTEVRAIISPNGANVVVNAGDELDVSNTLEGIVPAYGRGYFGNQVVNLGPESVTNEVFANIKEGRFNLDAVDAQLTIVNHTGVDFGLQINELSVQNPELQTNATLSAPFIGDNMHINRAAETPANNLPVTSERLDLTFSSQTANMAEVLSVLPSSITYDIELEVNPLGNVGGSNDFVYTDYGMDLLLNASAPLTTATDQLLLYDTVAIDVQEPANTELLDNINSGSLFARITNTFPHGATIELLLLNDSSEQIDFLVAADNAHISSGVNGAVASILEFPVSQEKLQNLYAASFVEIRARLDTEDATGATHAIFATNSIALELWAELNYRVSTE